MYNENDTTWVNGGSGLVDRIMNQTVEIVRLQKEAKDLKSQLQAAGSRTNRSHEEASVEAAVYQDALKQRDAAKARASKADRDRNTARASVRGLTAQRDSVLVELEDGGGLRPL